MTNIPVDPIYIIDLNHSSFSILELQPATKKYTSFIFKNCWQKIKEKVEEKDHLFDFYLSLMVVLTADFYQKRSIEKKLRPDRVNFKISPLTVLGYLEKAMERMDKSDLNLFKDIYAVLENSFDEIKKKWGFPLDEPCEYSYSITDKVLAATGDDKKCENYIKSRKNIGVVITPKIFESIQQELRNKYPLKEADIMLKLKETENKDHLSIFAIDVESYKPFIHIVNSNKEQIKMEIWKFLLMIENPNTPHRLYDFSERDKSSKYYKQDKFIYNEVKEGIIAGRLNPEESQFEIIKYDDSGDNNHGPKAIFKVDSTYLLCLYVTLKRLKDDKDRFTKFLEKAEAAIANTYNFEGIFF